MDITIAGDVFSGLFWYNLYSKGYDKDTPDRITGKELASLVKASDDYCAESIQKQGTIELYPDFI